MARGLLGIIVAVAVFFTNACCAFGMESQPAPVQAAKSSCCHHATKGPTAPQAPDHSSPSQRACCQKITPGHDDGGRVVNVSPFLTIAWLTATPLVDAASVHHRVATLAAGAPAPPASPTLLSLCCAFTN